MKFGAASEQTGLDNPWAIIATWLFSTSHSSVPIAICIALMAIVSSSRRHC
jgi:hypothetical protein